MKKLHGTYSIQPLTLSDISVADDAAIKEYKLDLEYSTKDLYDAQQDALSGFNDHINNSNNPHGEELFQKYIVSNTIKSEGSVLNVKNYYKGLKTTLDVEGNVQAYNLRSKENVIVGGDLVVSGSSSVQGETHLTGDVIIDGNLSVKGGSTIVSSTVTDYDRITITPSSQYNDTAILVSPDSTDLIEDPDAPVEDTYKGKLVELQSRINGENSPVLTVDYKGDVSISSGKIELNDVNIVSDGSSLTIDTSVHAPSFIADEYVCVNSNSIINSDAVVVSSGDGITYTTNTSGDTAGRSFTVCGFDDFVDVGDRNYSPENPSSGVTIYWDDERDSAVVHGDVAVENSNMTLDNSPLRLKSESSNDVTLYNRNSNLSIYIGDEGASSITEIGPEEALFMQETTRVENLSVNRDLTVKGNLITEPGNLVDGVDVGVHTHSGEAGMGERLPATSVIGLQEFLDGHMETVQDYVGAMVTSNSESGIAVTYDDDTGKLNFDVNDFTITLTGNATGSGTVTDLGNASINVSVNNSDKVDGLHAHSGRNNEANKVVRTDGNGYLQAGWINTTSGDAGTTTISRVYASNDGYIRYYTPANFATQLLALGGTVKNSHTHTDVNGLTPVRGSSTFAGKDSYRQISITSRSNTNYSVAVTPTAATNGNLGEVWVIKSTTYFRVYNNGTFTGAFDYILLG